MKKILLTLVSLLIITGCSPAASESAQPAKFAVYFTDTNEIVFSEDDLLAYDDTTDTFSFTDDAVKRLKPQTTPPTLDDSLYQKPFTVKIGNEEIYTGKFWSGVSSMSENGIIMLDTLMLSPKNNTLTVYRNYPDSSPLTDKEKTQLPEPAKSNQAKIDDERITEHFKKLNKLVTSKTESVEQ